MPRTSYQYGTSPRKYEPEYTTKRPKQQTTKKKNDTKKATQKSDAKKRIEKQKAQKAKERKNRVLQVMVVATVFGMLLALSYREIAIMEMFNQTKELENQLAVIQKENGQIEKSIKEEESKLNWNEIKKTATEQLGMQVKTAEPIELDKFDNVETTNKLIEEEKTNIIEEIINYFINKSK